MIIYAVTQLLDQLAYNDSYGYNLLPPLHSSDRMNREIPEMPAERSLIMNFNEFQPVLNSLPSLVQLRPASGEKKNYAHSYTSDFSAG